MPEDNREKLNNKKNCNVNNNSSQVADNNGDGGNVSSGAQPDDNLLRHSSENDNNVGQDVHNSNNHVVSDNSGSSSNSSSNNRDNESRKYKSRRRNKDGFSNKKKSNSKSNDGNPIQKNSSNNPSNKSNSKKKGDGLAKTAAKQAVFRGMDSVVPGLGKIAELASQASKKRKEKKDEKEKKKNGENKENKDESKDKNKEKADNQKSSDDNKNDDKKESKGKSLLGSFIGNSFFRKVIMIALPVTIFLMIAIPILLVNAISNFALEFFSSMLRLEPLTELFTFDTGDTNAEYEKAYMETLSKVYEDRNKDFNPDYVSATMAVMKDNSQYAENGQYDYSNLVPKTLPSIGFFHGAYDSHNIETLANIFSKIKETDVNGGTSNVTTTGNGDVASDAGLMVGSGHNIGTYTPANLVEVGETDVNYGVCNAPEQVTATQEAWNAFQVMRDAAANEGKTLRVNTAYRSYDYQQCLHDGGIGVKASPGGYSDHQTGSCFDIGDAGRSITNSDILTWLENNAHKYGFAQSQANVSGERHHYRYVGTKVSNAYKNYLNNGGESYLAFQESAEGKSVIGNNATPDLNSNSNNSNNSNSNNSNNTSTSSKTSTSSSSTSNGGVEMVKRAQQEIGYKEEAGGITKYGQWFGMPDAEWCAIFIVWLANQVGVPEDVIPKDGAVVSLQAFFQDKGLYHPVSDTSYQPKPGDLIFYNHPHVGLVEEYTNGNLKTIEGNASITVDRVIEKDGPEWFGDVAGYASPNYGNVAASSTSSSSSGVKISGEDSEEVRNELKEFLKSQLKKLDGKEAVLDSMVDQIFRHKRSYYDFIGKKIIDDCSTTVSSSAGSCTYSVNGVRGERLKTDESMTFSNLKVRLMECKTSNPKPLANEELVDFEKYILGVTYGEVGEEAPTEAAKAQAIATRSFSLARPSIMGNFEGTRFVQENGQTILQLRSCTMDQVYCDPDQGCVKVGGVNSEVHSGTTGGKLYKGPLAADNPLRAAVAETNGQVLLDSNGRVIYANYWDTDQRAWASAAREGKNVTEILVTHYKSDDAAGLSTPACDGATASNNKMCPNTDASGTAGTAASGDYANWKQCDERWGSEPLGGRSICMAGCLATSMAMLIAKNGVATTVNGEFNPGSFVRTMKSAGGFAGEFYQWSVTPKVVPSYQDLDFLSYYPSDVAEKLKQGYSGIIWVGKAGRSCHHWVAIDKVENGIVSILDPAGNNGPVDITYPNKCGVHYFKLK